MPAPKPRPNFLGRPAPPLPLAAALLAGWLAAGWNLLQIALRLPSRAASEGDFYQAWLAARIAADHGLAAAYDAGPYLALIGRTGRQVLFVEPPPMLLLVAPLAALPFGLALFVWTAALAAALVVTWRLCAAGDVWTRLALLGAFFAAYPVAICLYLGQVTVLAALAPALCWWLLAAGHSRLAGVALALAVLKPQAAFLVPAALLVAGRWDTVVAWALAAGALAVGSVAALGTAGVHNYLHEVSLLSVEPIGKRYALEALTGPGPIHVVALLVLLGLAAATCRRGRRSPEIVIAVGALASLLASPYVNSYEFTLLLVGAWLVLRLRPPPWFSWPLLPLYFLVVVPNVTGPALAVLAEVVFLALLAVLAWRLDRTPSPRTAGGGRWGVAVRGR